MALADTVATPRLAAAGSATSIDSSEPPARPLGRLGEAARSPRATRWSRPLASGDSVEPTARRRLTPGNSWEPPAHPERLEGADCSPHRLGRAARLPRATRTTTPATETGFGGRHPASSVRFASGPSVAASDRSPTRVSPTPLLDYRQHARWGERDKTQVHLPGATT